MPGKSKKHLVLGFLAVLTLAACGGGGGGDGGGITPPGAGTTVIVSGAVSYEFVPPNAGCFGLNFAATTARPIRGATVVLLSQTGAELARTTSSLAGAYSFAGVNANTMVRVRVLAEAKNGNVPGWDVEIRDNFDNSATPPALGVRPLYALDGALFNTGNANVSHDLLAGTGWGGNSYTGTRAAAPFAILDAIYSAMQFVITYNTDSVFPPLDAFWSVNNTTDITDFNIDTGEIGGSFYIFSADSLFITGDANDDTDEFDDHIVVHEWGHFLDDVLLRSDSPGGTHFLGDRLDSRLAFNEGWPTAFAAMVHNDPSYCETGVPGTNGGFEINAEGGPFGGQGWYDEVSVVRFIYDLWDTDSEGTDTGSIDISLLDQAFENVETSPAFLNLHTYATELRAITDATGDALIDSQLGDEQTVDGVQLDIWGTNETNQATATTDVLPIYVDMVADGTTTNICSNSQFDTRAEKDGNKLSEFRYIRLDVPVADEYNVSITSTTPTPITPDPDDRDQSDPDMRLIFNGGFLIDFFSPAENSETGTTPFLQAGTYVADLRDWRYADPERPASYPPVVCFNVRFDPTP
ncbi:MAG: hypothetical protein ACR2QT_05945 [Woeseiaceae bacterium]